MCKYANLKGIEVRTEQQVEALAKVLSRKSRIDTISDSKETLKNGRNSSNFGVKRTITR